jgi:hypothetical protein
MTTLDEIRARHWTLDDIPELLSKVVRFRERAERAERERDAALRREAEMEAAIFRATRDQNWRELNPYLIGSPPTPSERESTP